jgi:hypothetical protein
VLAAVAAPEETRTASLPLDVEAEMAAVLDAVAGITSAGQVRILEVASLATIRAALEHDAYHVLHLSAHGSAEAVELEDEDGNPVSVGLAELVRALQLAGRVVPLIVLSSCSGGAAGGGALAAGLAGRGADRVIAMLAPVTDGYATVLAGHLYRQLAAHPELSAGRALARARCLAEDTRPREPGRVPVPEFGVVTLVAAGGDGPLADPALPSAPLAVATSRPGGAGAAGGGADRPAGAAARGGRGAAAGPAGGGEIWRGGRGGADRDRGDRQDRAGRAGDGPAG